MKPAFHRSLHRLTCALTFLVLGAGAQAADILAKRAHFTIAPQPLASALIAFSTQSGVQIATAEADLSKLKSTGVDGTRPVGEALELLLKGTGLKFGPVGANTITVTGPATQTPPPANESAAVGAQDPIRLVQVTQAGVTNEAHQEARPEEEGDDTKGVPEMLVKGSRSLNTDIRRTEDDPQPYVVFDAREIERSQAVNLEDFLRNRLPMNTASGSPSQMTGVANPTSSINLRGLGPNQTLILVDGRRMPGLARGLNVIGAPTFDVLQPDINGIPLAAIERVEVLPSTAGGIYGGGATGGVINIVMKRNFSGVDVKANYANTFDTDASTMRLDASAGFSLEGGRTQVTVAASSSTANDLTLGDRDFTARAIKLQLKNNPAAILDSTTPPLGATVNISSVDGDNLTLDSRYGGGALGWNITHLPLGYAGPASDSGAALVRNAGSYNLDMPAGPAGLERGLISAPSMKSATLNLRRAFGSHVEAFVDLSSLGNKGHSLGGSAPSVVYGLPADADNNPFGQDINVSFPAPGLATETESESTTDRIGGGVIARFGKWNGEAAYSWSRSSLESRGAPTVVDFAGETSLGDNLPAADGRPALNALQEGNTFPIDFTPYLLPAPNYFVGPMGTVLKDATLRLSGPAVRLPGGALNLSMLAERREETVESGFIRSVNSFTRLMGYAFMPRRLRNADSYYLEARAPLIATAWGLPFARELELQASVRRDEYETVSSPISQSNVASMDGPFPAIVYSTSELASTDYTVGLRYVPSESLTLRASFGTGFLPPSILQIASRQNTYNFSFGYIDRKRGNTDTYVGRPYAYILGGNPGVRPEQSESASAGIILTPQFAPGLRLSVDYTRIRKTDEIKAPNLQYILDHEDAFPGRIQRATAKLPGDPASWAAPITALDTTYINIASTEVVAYDIQADYTLNAGDKGEFHWYAFTTWQPHFRNRILPEDPLTDSVGFADGPLEWRGNLGMNWERGAWSLGWNMQYYDAYKVYSAFGDPFSTGDPTADTVLSQGSDTIPRQMYHDLIASYRFAASWLANTELSVGIQNVFDRSPPILATISTTDGGYSSYGDPRLRRYSISVRKSFN